MCTFTESMEDFLEAMTVRAEMEAGKMEEAKTYAHAMDVIEKGMIYIPKHFVAFFKRTL